MVTDIPSQSAVTTRLHIVRNFRVSHALWSKSDGFASSHLPAICSSVWAPLTLVKYSLEFSEARERTLIVMIATCSRFHSLAAMCRRTMASSKQAAENFEFWSGEREAEFYAKSRPEYQHTVIPWLIDFYQRKHDTDTRTKIPTAIDLQCGNGQLAGVLSSYCDRVIGIDVSQAQLDLAKKFNKHENVQYWCASTADLVTLCDGIKADIITIGMGVPPFNTKDFYHDVGGCLRPGGIFGAFGYYPVPNIEGRPELGQLLEHFLENNLRSLLPGLFLLRNHYRSINPPFDDLERREARVKYPTSKERLVAIIQSLQKDIEDGGEALKRFNKLFPNLENAHMFIDVFGIMARVWNLLILNKTFSFFPSKAFHVICKYIG